MVRKSRPRDNCRKKYPKAKAAGAFGKNILGLSDGSEQKS
jgi:hypothetical protein